MLSPNKRPLTDKRISEKYRQGTSARESCPNDILVELLNKEQGFKQLVDKFEGKYARGTISKYLKELVKDNMISYRNANVEFGKLERPYCLTDNGREEARKQGLLISLAELPYPVVEDVILSYKGKVLEYLISISNDPPTEGHILEPLENKHGYMYMPIPLGGPFKIPTYVMSSVEKDRLDKMKLLQRLKEEQKLELKPIDDLLRNYNFSEDEIVRMWLRNGHPIEIVLRFRSEKSNPSQEEIEEMRRGVRTFLNGLENRENGR